MIERQEEEKTLNSYYTALSLLRTAEEISDKNVLQVVFDDEQSFGIKRKALCKNFYGDLEKFSEYSFYNVLLRLQDNAEFLKYGGCRKLSKIFWKRFEAETRTGGQLALLSLGLNLVEKTQIGSSSADKIYEKGLLELGNIFDNLDELAYSIVSMSSVYQYFLELSSCQRVFIKHYKKIIPILLEMTSQNGISDTNLNIQKENYMKLTHLFKQNLYNASIDEELTSLILEKKGEDGWSFMLKFLS